MDEIQRLMLKEHAVIKSMLFNLEEFSKNSPLEAFRFLDKFKWFLEKHFFIEEKAIFMLYNQIFGEEVSEIFELMQEHGDIIQIIKSLEEGEEFKNLDSLKEILEKHSEFEEKKFYPRLENELNSEQKELIISKLKEVIKNE